MQHSSCTSTRQAILDRPTLNLTFRRPIIKGGSRVPPFRIESVDEIYVCHRPPCSNPIIGP